MRDGHKALRKFGKSAKVARHILDGIRVARRLTLHGMERNADVCRKSNSDFGSKARGEELPLPFADPLLLRWHYDRHKDEFSFPDENAYLAAAEAFMAGVAVEPTKECWRADGDRVRFNRHSGYLGVDDGRGVIRTFFKPRERYIAGGYFKWECAKRTDEL